MERYPVFIAKRLNIVKMSVPLNLNNVGALTVAYLSKACSKATALSNVLLVKEYTYTLMKRHRV